MIITIVVETYNVRTNIYNYSSCILFVYNNNNYNNNNLIIFTETRITIANNFRVILLFLTQLPAIVTRDGQQEIILIK